MSKCFECCGVFVPGIGPTNASIMIIAERPGYNEMILGEPLVGRCGVLTNKMLCEAGLKREEVYLTNVVKCYAKNNRTPDLEEINECKKYLWREIINVAPKVIITFGKVAASLFLKKEPAKIALKDYVGIVNTITYKSVPPIHIIFCYHPSYLLRGNKEEEFRTIDALRKAKELCQ